MYFSSSGKHFMYLVCLISELIDRSVIHSSENQSKLNHMISSRQLKNRNVCRQQIKQEKADEQIRGLSKGLEKTTHFSKSILNQDEENVAYQELGEIAKESRYDDLS